MRENGITMAVILLPSFANDIIVEQKGEHHLEKRETPRFLSLAADESTKSEKSFLIGFCTPKSLV